MKESNVINNFRETLNIPKPLKDANKIINRMEDRSNQLIESKEVSEKIKSFNKDTDSKDLKLGANISQKFNNDDEFNH